jgi:hypothetical protein
MAPARRLFPPPFLVGDMMKVTQELRESCDFGYLMLDLKPATGKLCEVLKLDTRYRTFELYREGLSREPIVVRHFALILSAPGWCNLFGS